MSADYVYSDTPGRIWYAVEGYFFTYPEPRLLRQELYEAWLNEGNVPDPYVKPPVDPAVVRAARLILLQNTDWTQLYDVPLSDAARVAFAEYRQLLRDISTQPDFPEVVVWPVAPTPVNTDDVRNPYPGYQLAT